MRRLTVLPRIALLCAGVMLASPALANQADAGDAGAITHVLMATFDRPDARLVVEPVTVRGDIAVAGWAQGEMGGRALLRRHDAEWRIALCSGDALKEAAALRQSGLTPAEADEMAAAVVAAEAALDPVRVELFSRFDGVVMMEADGSHPPVEGHGTPHHGASAGHHDGPHDGD